MELLEGKTLRHRIGVRAKRSVRSSVGAHSGNPLEEGANGGCYSPFWEEYRSLVKHYGLERVEEETVETVGGDSSPVPVPLDESRG
jgi:hypothetical protein